MEFREMRRNKQQLSTEECREILRRNTSGVLAVLGDGGYPYAVPLSYVAEGDCIYLHCAKTGHKLDAIRTCDKVSFCVTDADDVKPEEYTTYFRSVIAFGRASVIESEEEILRTIGLLALRYAPEDTAENRNNMIGRELSALCMVKIEIEHMTGKEAKELMRSRRG